MSENIQIDKNTKIVFGLGWFIGTLGSFFFGLIGVLYGFYNFVYDPQIQSIKKDNVEIKGEFKELSKTQTQNMIEFNDAVSKLNSNLEIINNRFNDLNRSRNNSPSSNGGFSMNNNENMLTDIN